MGLIMQTKRKTLRNRNRLSTINSLKYLTIIKRGFGFGLITHEGMRDALTLKPSVLESRFNQGDTLVLRGKSRARLGQ